MSLHYSFRIQQGSSQDYRTSNEEDFMVIKETWGRNLLNLEVIARFETRKEAEEYIAELRTEQDIENDSEELNADMYQ